MCMLVHRVPAVPSDARRGCQTPETKVTDNCELPCACWEPNLGHLLVSSLNRRAISIP